MWNPFKKKHLVPVDDCLNRIIEAMKHGQDPSYSLWDWLEIVHGVKRKYNHRQHQNYLVFDSERDYIIFLLKL